MTADTDRRACTCHPSEAPEPCQHRHAYSECRRAALVERVADIISMVFEGQGITETAEGVIDLIRAEVLEEAAGVANTASVEPGLTTNERMLAHGVAAAIRALKEKQ